MGRARGSNAVSALAFESIYGTPPASGFFKMPFSSSALGEEQGLIEDDTLGLGRDPQQPGRDVVNNSGDVVMPLCARNIGMILKLLLGAPTTVAGLAATGSLTFSDQPANNATITIAAQAFTFTTGNPTTNQIKIGTTLVETVANAVRALNQSAVAGVMAATYSQDVAGNIIRVVHDTPGTGGNSFALAAGSSPASNATVSGATLSGGAASGAYNHTFGTGLAALPSASIEIGLPEVPEYAMNWGVKANSLGIQLQRSGLLSATVGLIAQGETIATSTAAGTPTERAIARFSQFSGLVKRLGVPIGDLVGGQINLMNGLDPLESIRGDGRIGGIDEGKVSFRGQATIRYGSRDLQTLAENGTASEFEYSWSIPGTIFSLREIVHEVYLPKPKRPITGPGGVQATYDWQAAKNAAAGRAGTIVLVNDVASY